jgi:hypothetical protein
MSEGEVMQPRSNTFPAIDGGFLSSVVYGSDWHGSAVGRACHSTRDGAAMRARAAFEAEVAAIVAAIERLPETVEAWHVAAGGCEGFNESVTPRGNGTWDAVFSAPISRDGRVLGMGNGPTAEAARAAAWRDFCQDRRKALAIFKSAARAGSGADGLRDVREP